MADHFDKRAPISKDGTAGTGAGISHLLGMGMGMGMAALGGPQSSSMPNHVVYGNDLLDQHEWRYTVFLVEFLMTTNWQAEIKVPQPNPDDSEETKSELKKLRDKQDHEGRAERYDEIVAESDEYLGLFENLCYFDAHSHPALSDLVQTVDQIGWTVVQYYKEYYGRKRPSYLDPTIRPVIRVPTHPSYPSGHSTQSHLIKNVLLDVFDFRGKEFLDELQKVATRIAENREWAGVHFESDTLAGENLASSIWSLAKRNPNYSRLLETAKAEAKRYADSGHTLLIHPTKK